MQKVFDCMHHSCALDAKSRLIDIGAGLGRCGLQPSVVPVLAKFQYRTVLI